LPLLTPNSNPSLPSAKPFSLLSGKSYAIPAVWLKWHIQPALMFLVHLSSLFLKQETIAQLLTKGIWLAATGVTHKHG